jgi:hypothetical protein
VTRLYDKLASRFGVSCAGEVVSEIESHLVEAADELKARGLPLEAAERLSIARFGMPERAALFTPYSARFESGDRYWGHIAFGAALLGALGLAILALAPAAASWAASEALRPGLTVLLLVYGFACRKAKSFSMLRQSICAIALLVLAAGLFSERSQPAAWSPLSPTSRLLAMRTLGQIDAATMLGGMPFAELPGMRAHSDSEAAPPLVAGSERAGSLKLDRIPPGMHGMAPLSMDPWGLAKDGFLPEVSQILLAWLFFVLMTNAAVCWIGSLEFEQKGGAALIQ